MKKEQVAKKILKTVQNWNNPRKNISGAGAGIQLWVLRNFFKNFRSRKNLLKKQHKGTSTVVIFSLILNFSVFFYIFFSFSDIFFIFGIFLGFPGNPGIFQSHGIFLGFLSQTFWENPMGFFSHGIGIFFRGMGNPTKKPPLIPSH